MKRYSPKTLDLLQDHGRVSFDAGLFSVCYGGRAVSSAAARWARAPLGVIFAIRVHSGHGLGQLQVFFHHLAENEPMDLAAARGIAFRVTNFTVCLRDVAKFTREANAPNDSNGFLSVGALTDLLTGQTCHPRAYTR